MSGTRVLDELLCFLGDIIFQVPVRTFMDNKCFNFDPSIPITEEHKKVHAEYKALIDTLLESYCEDNGITINDVLGGIKKMSEVPDIKEVFQVVFEQVWAAHDFNIFVQVMCKRNLAIQELAVRLLMQATGMVPEVLQSETRPQQKPVPSTSGTVMATQKNEEEELLQRVLLESKREDDERQRKRLEDETDLKRTLDLSQKETAQVQEQQKALAKSIQKMVISDSLPPVPGAGQTSGGASSKPSQPPIPQQPRQPMAPRTSSTFSSPPKQKVEQFGVTKGGPSGAEAANSWLQSAMADSQQSDTHKAVMAQMEKMDQTELKRRQDFLKLQREKLLKMKQEEREKQLQTAVKANPKRPQSARTARAALANQGNAPAPTSQVTSEEEQKRVAMRKAIADKLRMEMLGKQ